MTPPSWGAVPAEARWRVALAMIGPTGRAHALGQKLLTVARPFKLQAEEITTTGQHPGNFPQVFTHLGLIEAASLLIKPERQAGAAQGI
jgi:GH15 family glucan-1,4-alpha-glucosidase